MILVSAKLSNLPLQVSDFFEPNKTIQEVVCHFLDKAWRSVPNKVFRGIILRENGPLTEFTDNKRTTLTACEWKDSFLLVFATDAGQTLVDMFAQDEDAAKAEDDEDDIARFEAVQPEPDPAPIRSELAPFDPGTSIVVQHPPEPFVFQVQNQESAIEHTVPSHATKPKKKPQKTTKKAVSASSSKGKIKSVNRKKRAPPAGKTKNFSEKYGHQLSRESLPSYGAHTELLEPEKGRFVYYTAKNDTVSSIAKYYEKEPACLIFHNKQESLKGYKYLTASATFEEGTAIVMPPITCEKVLKGWKSLYRAYGDK